MQSQVRFEIVVCNQWRRARKVRFSRRRVFARPRPKTQVKEIRLPQRPVRKCSWRESNSPFFEIARSCVSVTLPGSTLELGASDFSLYPTPPLARLSDLCSRPIIEMFWGEQPPLDTCLV